MSKCSDAVCDGEQVGLLTPDPAATQQLRTGQVGYVITGMKSTRAARLGDTWHLLKQPVEPLPGFKPIKSMVFAGDLSELRSPQCSPHCVLMKG